jgi:hypothetical protein
MIVALVRYVDACEPGRRHSDCPFAVETAGQRTCHEECRGVIASLLRRGRGAPEPGFPAFDARQLRLSEPNGAPDILWHTSSLLQIVVAALRTHPLRRDGSLSLRRLVDATSALGALGSRGLDPDHLVRRGVAKTVKLGLAGWLGNLERSDDPRSSWEHVDRWRVIFEEGVAGQASTGKYIRAALSGQTAQRLDAWIESASLEDVLLWRPPQSNPEPSLVRPADEDVELWTWIVERFTQTYLERWSLASLKREYTFVQGSWRPSFATGLLAERTVTREEVATALADRALVKDDVVDPSTMDSFTEQAVALLEDGQRNAAAALFDAARTLKPTDMMAQNNFAFCILVDKPGQARELLADALAQGARDPAVTLCNLALAESLLGHADAALKACAEGYGAADDSQTAYLWIRDNEDWAVGFTRLRPWAIRLGVELEQSVGAPGSIWAERLERLILLKPRSASSDPSSTRTGEEDL